MPSPRRSLRKSGTNPYAIHSKVAPPSTPVPVPVPVPKERDEFNQGSPQRPQKSFLATAAPTTRATRSATTRAKPLESVASATQSAKKEPAKISTEGKLNNGRGKARKRRRSEKEESFKGVGDEAVQSALVLRDGEDGPPLPKKHKAKRSEVQEDDEVAIAAFWLWENAGTRRKSESQTSKTSTGSRTAGEELIERRILSKERTPEDEEPHKPTIEDRALQKSTVERSTTDIADKVPAVVEGSVGDENDGVGPKGDTLETRDDSGGELAAKVADASACQQEKTTGTAKGLAGFLDPTASQASKRSDAVASRAVRQFIAPTSTKKATEGTVSIRRPFLLPTRKSPSLEVPNIASSRRSLRTPSVPVNKSKSANQVAVQDKKPKGPTLDKVIERLFEEFIDMDQLADETLSREYWGIGRVFKERPAIYLGFYKLTI